MTQNIISSLFFCSSLMWSLILPFISYCPAPRCPTYHSPKAQWPNCTKAEHPQWGRRLELTLGEQALGPRLHFSKWLSDDEALKDQTSRSRVASGSYSRSHVTWREVKSVLDLRARLAAAHWKIQRPRIQTPKYQLPRRAAVSVILIVFRKARLGTQTHNLCTTLPPSA